jgi:hypothetical protein
MSLLRSITSGLRSLLRKDQVDRKLDEELRACHVPAQSNLDESCTTFALIANSANAIAACLLALQAETCGAGVGTQRISAALT